MFSLDLLALCHLIHLIHLMNRTIRKRLSIRKFDDDDDDDDDGAEVKVKVKVKGKGAKRLLDTPRGEYAFSKRVVARARMYQCRV